MLPITADGWATAPRSWSPGAAQVLQGWIPWGLARRRTSRRGAPRAACGAGWGANRGYSSPTRFRGLYGAVEVEGLSGEGAGGRGPGAGAVDEGLSGWMDG